LTFRNPASPADQSPRIEFLFFRNRRQWVPVFYVPLYSYRGLLQTLHHHRLHLFVVRVLVCLPAEALAERTADSDSITALKALRRTEKFHLDPTALALV
jgi:hypothetical protein